MKISEQNLRYAEGMLEGARGPLVVLRGNGVPGGQS